MSIFNEIEDGGQYSQLLQRRFNMLGASPAPAMMPEVAPTIVVESDRVEWGFLKGEVYGGTRVNLSAVAGQFCAAQLYLPSTSKQIAVVTSIRAFSGTGVNISRAQGIGAGVAGWVANTVAVADGRWNPNASALICERYTGVATPLGNGPIDRVTGAAMLDTFSPFVITPGTSLLLLNDIVNQPLDFVARFYLRPALPGELG